MTHLENWLWEFEKEVFMEQQLYSLLLFKKKKVPLKAPSILFIIKGVSLASNPDWQGVNYGGHRDKDYELSTRRQVRAETYLSSIWVQQQPFRRRWCVEKMAEIAST